MVSVSNNESSSEKFEGIPKHILCMLGISCIVILVLCCFIFGWKREWNIESTIDHEVWGTLGDFIGGFIGTIFALLSVFLVYLTFRSQRILTVNSDQIQKEIAREAKEAQSKLACQTNDFQKELSALSIVQAEKQRFNDLFFELLHRYQDLSKELTNAFNNDNKKIAVNYFDSAMDDMYYQYVQTDIYHIAVKKSSRLYAEFYLANASHLAPLFRTLYRIMELIDSSDISTQEKLRYAKIVRAQLRESELFFLRYNCLTPYGENFIEYINSYRLIKHLPIMSLLEFKYIRDKFENDKLTYLTLNMIFRNVWRRIYRITVGKADRGDNLVINPTSSKYCLSLDMSTHNKTTLMLTININRQNKMPMLKSLSKLNDSDLQLLLKNFLMEVYRYSNFKKYNDKDIDNLKFEISKTTDSETKVLMAYVKSNEPLRLSHPRWDKEYGI